MVTLDLSTDMILFIEQYIKRRLYMSSFTDKNVVISYQHGFLESITPADLQYAFKDSGFQISLGMAGQDKEGVKYLGSSRDFIGYVIENYLKLTLISEEINSYHSDFIYSTKRSQYIEHCEDALIFLSEMGLGIDAELMDDLNHLVHYSNSFGSYGIIVSPVS